MSRRRKSPRDSAQDVGTVDADSDYVYGLIDLAGAYDRLDLTSAPSDADGYGYFAGDDCDDSDATVYAGAPETRHDGIDLDCNGHDLTIEITKAMYNAGKDRSRCRQRAPLAGMPRLRWQATER